MLRSRLVVASLAMAMAMACGVRAPSRIDVDAMIKARGVVDARQDLAARIAADSKDIAARLALATLDDKTGRPTSAIEQLEAVLALGGPIGTRWHADDRVRLARLLAARGRARLAREASTALSDLTRAQEFGAAVEHRELVRARVLRAIAQLRHVDRKERAAGMRELAALWTAGGDPAWAGARGVATHVERGQFGIWLWSVRAKRAAWEELDGWRAATTLPRDPTLAAAYLTARAWWVPSDGPPPAADDLIGPDRCRYTTADGCSAVELMKREPRDEAAIAALLAAPTQRNAGDQRDATPAGDRDARTPAGQRDSRAGDQRDALAAASHATAWMQLTLLQALRGEASWGPALAARIDLASIPTASIPAPFRSAFSILAGRGPVAEAGTLTELEKRGLPITAADRLLLAAGRVLRGAPERDVIEALGKSGDPRGGVPSRGDPRGSYPTQYPARGGGPNRDVVSAWADGGWLLDVVAAPAESVAHPLVTAAVANTRTRVQHGLDETALRRVVESYLRDPAVGDRLGRDAVAASVDAGTAQASLGAVFDALGDPARARTAWQAAVDASPEIDNLRGLAEATARAKDPDAALVATITAAAAWGDPAVVWVSVGRSLLHAGEHVHALEAARNAIGLASSTVLVEALDVAIAASDALGRTAQVAELTASRARVTPTVPERPGDPTDAAAALLEYQRTPNAGVIAQLWVAARWNRRHVAVRSALLDAITPDDPRRAVVIAELVALASDRDSEVGRDAVRALRPTR